MSNISDNKIHLTDVEMETLRKATAKRSLSIDENRREYTESELRLLGIIRESYTVDEMKERGFDGKTVITRFDDAAKSASDLLSLNAPFNPEIKKWQMPIAVKGVRFITTVLPPNTFVKSHAHVISSPENPGGGIRLIIKGSIIYNGKKYGVGDWFFIPNGVPYSFTTDPDIETMEAYDYGYTGHLENRFAPMPDEV